MTLFRAIILVALGAAAALAVDRLVLAPEPVGSDAPAVDRSDRAPGSPPLVWLGGTLEGVSQASVAVREGGGPRVELERAAAGATRFYELDGDRWATLAEEDTGAVEAGQEVCVEALLDGSNLLALRVFLGSTCGPA